ncbi:MAG: hypothetical protein ACR2QO_17925 [Acidimicrobiales bacterium]
MLKPAIWDGLRGNARVHVWIGTPAYPLVVVAYADLPVDGRVDASAGWDDLIAYAVGVDGDDIAYATTATAYGRSDQLVVDAFDNLGDDLIDYELIESEGGRMLVSAGEPMAAERSLSEGSMLMAHEKLDAGEIAVSVARRGSLVACALDSGQQVRKTLTSIHHETYREAVADGQEVFDRLLVFQNGYLSGLLDIEMSSNGQEVNWHVAGS